MSIPMVKTYLVIPNQKWHALQGYWMMTCNTRYNSYMF